MICILCNKREAFIKKRNLCSRCYQKEWRQGKIDKKIYCKEKFPQICKQCGKTFLITKFWKDKGTKNFCSIKCVSNWRTFNMRGLKGTHIKPSHLTCEFCKETKNLLSSEIIKNRFCSKKCDEKFHIMVKEKISLILNFIAENFP